MTKKPKDKEEIFKFWEDYKLLEGDRSKLAKKWECSESSICRWLKDKNIRNVKGKRLDDNSNSYKNMSLDELQHEAENNSCDIDAYEVEIDLEESCLIVCMSDVHIGNKHTRYDEFAKDCRLISKYKNVYAFFNGDLLDFPVSDGPSDLGLEQIWSDPKISKEYSKRWIEEIAGSMLAMVTGCHDDWEEDPFLLRFEETIITGLTAKDAMVINLNIGEVSYKIFMSHKMKYNSLGSRSYTVFANEMRNKEFDMGFDAHRHKPGIGAQFIKEKLVVAVSGGSYKALDGYAKKNGYTPIPFSIPGVYFDAKRKVMISFINWRDGIRYLENH